MFKYRFHNRKQTIVRKVIFVCGTSYSGTTFFDMILANDPVGFSCGEIHALFHPYRPHHFNPECGCGDSDCNLWAEVLKGGKENVYDTIFELMPNIKFIVDSSKNPFWISYQSGILQKKKYSIKNILIWKTPLELAHSFDKRGRLKDWEKSWINYHRLFFTLINDWHSIKYYDLINKKVALKNVCNYLEIPYFSGKKKYWQKNDYHTLFGNTSAKIHLFSHDKYHFQEAESELTKTTGTDHKKINEKLKKIYYENANKNLMNYVNEKMAANTKFLCIENELARKDLVVNRNTESCIKQSELSKLKYSKSMELLKFIKYEYLMKYSH